MPSRVIKVGWIGNSNVVYIKRSTGNGVCDTCGSPTGSPKLYQFGYEFPDGLRYWSKGEYCSKECWLHRPNRLRESMTVADMHKTAIKRAEKHKVKK